MKKVLVFLLITVMFIGFAFISLSAPPPQIIVRSEEELAEMREMAEKANDEELDVYLRRMHHRINGLRNRENLIWFLELLDSLPIPYDTEMKFSSLVYYPTYESANFSIFFESKIEERYSYTFCTNEEREEGVIEKMFGENVSLLYESQDGRMRVYSPPPIWGRNPSSHGDFSFPMEIDGYFIVAKYFPEGVAGVVQRDIFRGMTVVSLKDEPWKTPLTTADALTVLRAATGMATLTEAEVVRFGIDGEPATADALRILRVAVGL